MRSFEGKLARLVRAIVVAAALLDCADADPLPTVWTEFRLNQANDATIDGPLNTSWLVVTGGAISASPTINATTLYIGNNAGYLNAIDLQTGSVVWTYHARNALMSAPLIYDGLVIVGEGDEQSAASSQVPVYVGLGPSAMVALDARTGARKWSTVLSGSAMPTPAIIDGVLVHHNGSGWLTAIDPQTGKVLSARNLHSVASMTAALPLGDDRFITIGVQENAVWALHAKDLSTLWKTTFPPEGSGHGDCPAVTDGVRIMCDYVMPVPPAKYTNVSSPAIEHAYALDVQTGRKIWDVTLQTGALPPRNEAAIPLLSAGRLYLGSAVAPWMHAIDPANGRVIWQTHVRAPVKGGIAESNGTIYFGDLKGYLWALDARSGAVIGDKLMRSGFNVGSPIIVGQTLIIGSRTGSLYALPLTTIAASHDK